MGAVAGAGAAVGDAITGQEPERPPWLIVAFGAALIPVMFSYGGWQNANYVAEEIKDPQRNVPRSLIIGTSIVVITYVLVNFVYLRALGHVGLASTLTPAADTARRGVRAGRRPVHRRGDRDLRRSAFSI